MTKRSSDSKRRVKLRNCCDYLNGIQGYLSDIDDLPNLGLRQLIEDDDKEI